MIGLIVLAALVAAPFVLELTRQPVTANMRREAPGQFAQLTQGKTHFLWLGRARGPVAVCIHGLTTPSFVWQGLARVLVALGFRVLIYDLYGRGYSDRPSGRQNRAFFLRQLEDLLVDQDLHEDLTILGYSMGGSIATAFAQAHPGRVQRLILLAPAGIELFGNSFASAVRGFPVLGDWLWHAVFPVLFRRQCRAAEDLDSSVDDIARRQAAELKKRGFLAATLSSMRGMLAETQESDHREISREDIPVLAVWGKADDQIPISAMGTLAQWNRACRHEVIDDAGHGLLHTHPHQIGAAIKAMLNDRL